MRQLMFEVAMCVWKITRKIGVSDNEAQFSLQKSNDPSQESDTWGTSL